MSDQIIKCAKCQNNANKDLRFRNEFTCSYPIRDKDGKIYCWDCYKGFSSCKGCGKSVANIKFPRSGQPEYPHCNGGVSYGCERISNDVEFICSKECSKNLATQKYQAWKEKLNQGWTKCEECWKFWIEGESNEEGWEWLKEEKRQWKFIGLAQPGQGKWCPDHRNWEEGGKQEYERKKVEYQKVWEALSNEEKLAEAKKEYRHGENVTELATRSEIPPMVLCKWREKDNHRRHNCPDCQLDNQPTENDNNLSISAGENGSENNQQSGKDEDSPKNQPAQDYNRLGKNSPGNNSVGLIIGGVAIVSFIFLATVLVLKGKNKK